MTGVEMVRMVNSGTEAVMSALRLARAATGRSKLIKFAGCYHGHCDAMLVKAGSGALTGGAPDSAGIPAELAGDTLRRRIIMTLPAHSGRLAANAGEVAAVIVELLGGGEYGRCPAVQPGFLQGLRTLCDEYGALLIFDEVITGFRLAPGGAQAHHARPSGSGHPRQDHRRRDAGGGLWRRPRRFWSRSRPWALSTRRGRFSGNPVAMAAGLAQLQILGAHAGSLF